MRDMFISGPVTLGNDPCNLCATKLRDKLEEKLHIVTAPLESQKWLPQHAVFVPGVVFIK